MDWENQRFSEDEVTAIIRRALSGSNQDTITHDELVDIAQKSGVSAAQLQNAIESHEQERHIDDAKQRVLRRERNEFRSHLMSYIIVNGALLLINLLTGPDYLWVLWPMIGWGIGLAFHAAETFMLDDAKLERKAHRLLRRERRRRRLRERAREHYESWTD
jgi:hypothetical protein